MCQLGEMMAQRNSVRPPVKPKARTVSVGPQLPFDGTPSSSPKGSPIRASVEGVVTPSSRGSPPVRHRMSQTGQLSAPTSQRTTPEISPRVSPRLKPGRDPPRRCPGGSASIQPSKPRAPTQKEYQDQVARDAYYRQSMFLMGQSNADRAAHRNVTGSLHGASPSRSVPLIEVREEDMARGSR